MIHVFSFIRKSFILLLVCIASSASYCQIESAANGDWETPGTWLGNAVPSSTDAVVIKHTVTLGNINAALNPTVASIQITNNPNTAILTITNDAVIHIVNDVTITGVAGLALESSLRATLGAEILIGGKLTISRNQNAGVMCGVVVNNSILDVGGDFRYTYIKNSNVAENGTEIDLGGAAVTVGGNLLLDLNEGGTGTGSDLNFTADGGSFSVSGDFTLNYTDNTSSTNPDIIVSNSSTAINIGGRLVIDDDSGTAATALHNQVEIIAPFGFRSTVVVGGDIEFRSLNAAQSVINVRNGVLNMKGSVTGLGTVTYHNAVSEAIFSGSITQVIRPTDYQIIRIANTSGNNLTLSAGQLRIIVALHMDEGIVQTGGADNFYLERTATSNIGTPTSFVTGGMKKIGSSLATDIPIGAVVNGVKYWAPLYISGIVGTSDAVNPAVAITFNYTRAAYSNLNTVTPINHVSALEYWTILHANPADAFLTSADIRFYWKNASWSQINDLNALLMASFNTAMSAWSSLGANLLPGSECDDYNAATGPETGAITAAGVTSFNQFTFGSSGANNPLPIVLSKFEAELHDNSIELRWETTEEYLSDYCSIEKSDASLRFSPIGKVHANGNSSELNKYYYTDDHPFKGWNYYRLKQVDLDGAYVYSNVISVFNDETEADLITVYPTLLKSNENIAVEITDDVGSEITYSFMSVAGRELQSGRIVVSETPGEIELNFKTSGLVILNLHTSKGIVKKKLIMLE
jgi:hypothetical protein